MIIPLVVQVVFLDFVLLEVHEHVVADDLSLEILAFLLDRVLGLLLEGLLEFLLGLQKEFLGWDLLRKVPKNKRKRTAGRSRPSIRPFRG